MVGTFGRGAYVLDDYSALRDVDATTLTAEAALFRCRPARLYDELGMAAAVWGDETAPNPPYGATLTYHVRDPIPADVQLELRIGDAGGETIRHLAVDGSAGVHRTTWDLHQGDGRDAERVAPGRYLATLGRVDGEEFTPCAGPVDVLVVPLER